MSIFTKNYIKDLLERAIKTFAQTLVADVTVGQGFEDINWLRALSIAGVAALISVLTSIASRPFGSEGTASMVEVN